MDIGEPRKIIEVEPATIPVPETIPIPETEPGPVEPLPVAPTEPALAPPDGLTHRSRTTTT
jgi:hypothetical protein